MFKRGVLVFLILFAVILNAGIFDRLFNSTRKISPAKAEITLFSIHALQSNYIDKSKLIPEKLLKGALKNIADTYPEIIAKYDEEKKDIYLQIYNKKFNIKVVSLNDVWDIPVLLQEVYKDILKEYKPENREDLDNLEYVAINGMLDTLDPHSYLFTPKEFKDFMSSTDGNFGGLGIVITTNDDGEIVVVSPIDDTPAMKAGIESGDIIVQINDESAINMTLNKAVERMRGKPDTKIVLGIKRKGVPNIIKFKLKRAIIKIKSVISAMPKKGIGYIKLNEFRGTAFNELKAKVEKLKKQGMKAMILDLRNNPGGLLSQAKKIADLFLDKGTIVSTVNDEEKEEETAEKDKDDILNIPLVVLTNGGSASAAEIVTAALKSNKRAIVMGRKTFGKGSVQNLMRVPGGGGLKITIAQYLTPGDISIQSIGIIPDYELVPAYVNKEKVSIFKAGSLGMKEKDLKEHINSKYVPKKIEKSKLVIHYFKKYKNAKLIRKEMRKRKTGVFRNDEEISIAVDLLQKMVKSKNKEKVYDIAREIERQQWQVIVKKLNKLGIKWHSMVKMGDVDTSKLKITLENNNLEGGKVNKLTFKATYPGEIENLTGFFDTDIPYLRNFEVVLGSFKNSTQHTFLLKLPENMPKRNEFVPLKMGFNNIKNIAKTEKIKIKTIPSKMPEIAFSYVIREKSGVKDGILEPKDDAQIDIYMKNEGKGILKDGKLLLINVNNNKEVFINKGTATIKLKPGESVKKTLSLKISKIDKIPNNPIKIVVSLYDYDSKYSAGFQLPFSLKIPEKKTKKVEKLKKSEKEINYSIKMPELDFDNSSKIVSTNKTNISFKIPNKFLDVFVYLNGEKVFYFRSSAKNNKKDFSVPIILKKHTNRVYILVRDKDMERKTSKVQYIIYPKGKKDSEF